VRLGGIMRIEIIGDQLKKARTIRGYSLLELATKVNTTKQSLWKVEAGKQKTLDDKLLKCIIYELNVTEDYLTGKSSEIEFTEEGLRSPFQIKPQVDGRMLIDKTLKRHNESAMLHDLLSNLSFYLDNVQALNSYDGITNNIKPDGVMLLEKIFKLLNGDVNNEYTEVLAEIVEIYVNRTGIDKN